MRENILLVEDEEDLRITLSDRLQNEGYIVRTLSIFLFSMSCFLERTAWICAGMSVKRGWRLPF
jgi:hypothetical protein